MFTKLIREITVADVILWLTQAVDRNSVVRKLQVLKMRGRAGMPGLHTIRMTDQGVQVFARIFERSGPARAKTDRLDARTLARLLWSGELESVWMPDERCRVLRRRLARRASQHLGMTLVELPPGRYYFTAEVPAPQVTLRSDPVELIVK